jgi:hypothetical protein
MRRKNLREKTFNSCNIKYLCINEIYGQTNNENDRNHYDIIDSNLDENVCNQINYDQLNAQTYETVEYAAVCE